MIITLQDKSGNWYFSGWLWLIIVRAVVFAALMRGLTITALAVDADTTYIGIEL